MICFNDKFSGYGGDCPEGIPVEFGLLSILAAFGAAFGILYMALTIKLGGRKKRNVEGSLDGSCSASDGTIQGFYGCHIEKFMSEGESSHWYKVADLLWHGKHGNEKLFIYISLECKMLMDLQMIATLTCL